MQKKQMQIWAGRIAFIILGVPVIFWIVFSSEKPQRENKEDSFGPQLSGVATLAPTPFPTPMPTPTPPPGLGEAENDLYSKNAVDCGNVRAWVPKERAPADAYRKSQGLRLFHFIQCGVLWRSYAFRRNVFMQTTNHRRHQWQTPHRL